MTINLELGVNRKKIIVNGERFILPPIPESLSLVNKIQRLIRLEFEIENIRCIHLHADPDHFFKKIGFLRRKIYLDDSYHAMTFELFEALGFKKNNIAFDPFRLRAITPFGYLNPAAAPIYYPHRDTWYAHPQSLMVLWIPLHDVEEEETFVFYPDYFDKPVANNSEVFDYDQWVKDGPELKIGWQNPNSGTTAIYPRSDVHFHGGNASGFSCNKASQLLFSGSHYHKTLPLKNDKTRFSIDVRFVHLDDIHQKIEAPNADNRSQGSTLKDYIFWN